MPTRNLVAQQEAAKKKDAEAVKRQAERDKAAKAQLAALKKDGAVLVATQSFTYPSKEQGGMRPVAQGDVFHPDDEPVAFAPTLFKKALQLKGAV